MDSTLGKVEPEKEIALYGDSKCSEEMDDAD
jgi:hypothetical protein